MSFPLRCEKHGPVCPIIFLGRYYCAHCVVATLDELGLKPLL